VQVAAKMQNTWICFGSNASTRNTASKKQLG